MSGTRVDLLQSLETVAALDSLPLPDHAPAIEAEAVAIDYQVISINGCLLYFYKENLLGFFVYDILR